MAGLLLLWWMYRGADDPVGEMACDMDDFDYDDDDPGVDVDEDD